MGLFALLLGRVLGLSLARDLAARVAPVVVAVVDDAHVVAADPAITLLAAHIVTIPCYVIRLVLLSQ